MPCIQRLTEERLSGRSFYLPANREKRECDDEWMTS